MAEYIAPFIINRTIGNLTFYQMEGRNLVRKKSSLTRRKVLHAPQFERTRHYAGLMGQASKIGSLLYQALPVYWRQSWMYRSFTGEAFTLLKKGKTDQEIQQLLWERYVKEVVDKQKPAASGPVIKTTPKRAYQKHNTQYWTGKTIKAKQREEHKQRVLRNAHLLSRASKLASTIYQRLPLRHHTRCYYHKLVALVIELLRQGQCEADIMEKLRPLYKESSSVRVESGGNQLHRVVDKKVTGVVNYNGGCRYFIAGLYKRFVEEEALVIIRESVPEFVS
jgi:hypothetical protein